MAAVLVILAILVWFSAVKESEAYNRLTGAHTTAWDALFVQLTVQAPPEKR